MNIFVTDPDPIKSAQNLDDRRVNKMILESCQMLSTVLRANGCPENLLPKTKSGMSYRSTHENHPCTKWAGKTQGNYNWLFQHMSALCDEFRKRYGHSHSCESNLVAISQNIHYIPEGELQPFQNSSMYKDESNVIEAYRKTMNHKWLTDKFVPKWTNGGASW